MDEKVYSNWWRFEFHRHTYIKSYKPGPAEADHDRLVVGKISLLTRVRLLFFVVAVFVFVRQGRELAVYHPTCLKVGDKT